MKTLIEKKSFKLELIFGLLFGIAYHEKAVAIALGPIGITIYFPSKKKKFGIRI